MKKRGESKCEHGKTFFSSGTTGNYLVCQECGERVEENANLGKWLRKVLGVNEPN